MGQAIPQTVFLAPTYRCQCRCAHCYAAVKGRESAGEMSTPELKAQIDGIKALGAVHLNLTGGEPLLREDIFELIAHAHRIGLITRISTNGDRLTRDCVAGLSRAGLNQCGVAVDDADPEAHDRLRGLPGLFERAVQGIRLLHEYGIESRLMTYACHRNLPQGVDRVLDFARKLRVRTVHINFPYASGRWAESFDEMFSEEEMGRLRRLQGSLNSPQVLLEFANPEAACCAARKSILYVNAGGEVTPCPIIPYVIGNIRDEPLADIWGRHADSLRLDYRGDCPMNAAAGREALTRHAESLLTRGSRCPGVRGDAQET